jgi:hypothetical protein
VLGLLQTPPPKVLYNTPALPGPIVIADLDINMISKKKPTTPGSKNLGNRSISIFKLS